MKKKGGGGQARQLHQASLSAPPPPPRQARRHQATTTTTAHSSVCVLCGSNCCARANKRISEIAQEVGVENSNYFSVMFRKIRGISPQEYRNQKKSRI